MSSLKDWKFQNIAHPPSGNNEDWDLIPVATYGYTAGTIEPSGYVREITKEEYLSKMQNYDIIGFRVVLREGK